MLFRVSVVLLLSSAKSSNNLSLADDRSETPVIRIIKIHFIKLKTYRKTDNKGFRSLINIQISLRFRRTSFLETVLH